MTEIWRDIVGYDGAYQVSNTGLVRSLNRTSIGMVNGRQRVRRLKGQFIKPHIDSSGYMQVRLSCDGRSQLTLLARLVAIAFIENPDSKEQVNHLDGNPLNNHVDNLQWATQQENQLHAIQVLRRMRGRSKLTPEVVAEIRQRHASGERQLDLAIAYGVSKVVVWRIVHRETWRHVA